MNIVQGLIPTGTNTMMNRILTLYFMIAVKHVATQGCGSDLPVAYMCQTNTVDGPEIALDVSSAGLTSHSSCECFIDSEEDGIQMFFDSQPNITECGNQLDLLFEDVGIQTRCGAPDGEQSTKGRTATIVYSRNVNATDVDSGYCIRFYSENNNTKLVLNCQVPHTSTPSPVSPIATTTSIQLNDTTSSAVTNITLPTTHSPQLSTHFANNTIFTTSNLISTSTPAIKTSNSSVLNNSTTATPMPLTTSLTYSTVSSSKSNTFTNATSSTQNIATITVVPSSNSSRNTTHISPTSPAVTTSLSQNSSTTTESSQNISTILPVITSSKTSNFTTPITSYPTKHPNTTNNNTNATPSPTSTPINTTTVDNNATSASNTTSIPMTSQSITDSKTNTNGSTLDISTSTPTHISTTPSDNTSISNNHTTLTTEITINNNNTVNTTIANTNISTEATTIPPDSNTTHPQSNFTSNITSVHTNTTPVPSNVTQNVTSDPLTNTTQSLNTNATEPPENYTTSLTTITDITPGNLTGNESTGTTPVYNNTTEESNSTAGNVTEGDMNNVTEATRKPKTTSGFWEPPVMNYDIPERSNNIVVILVPIAVVVLLCFVLAVTYVMCKRSKQALRRKSMEDELNKKNVTKKEDVKNKPENPMANFIVSNAANTANGAIEKSNNNTAKYEQKNGTIAANDKLDPNKYGCDVDTSVNDNPLLEGTSKPQTYEPSERERDLLQSLELSTIVIEHDPDDANRYFKKTDPGDWYRVIMKGKKPRDPNSTLNGTTKSAGKQTKHKSNGKAHSNTSGSDDAGASKKTKRSRRHSDLGLTDESVIKKNRKKSKPESNRRHSNIDHLQKSMNTQYDTREMSRSVDQPEQEVELVPVQARVVVSKPVSKVNMPVAIKQTNSNTVHQTSREQTAIKQVNNSEKTQPSQQNSMFASGKARNSVFGSNSKLKTEEASKRPDIVPPLDLKQTSDTSKINIDNDLEEFDL